MQRVYYSSRNIFSTRRPTAVTNSVDSENMSDEQNTEMNTVVAVNLSFPQMNRFKMLNVLERIGGRNWNPVGYHD